MNLCRGSTAIKTQLMGLAMMTIMKRASATWWFHAKRKHSEIVNIAGTSAADDTINVCVRSDDEADLQVQVRSGAPIFEELEMELNRRLLRVHVGDHDAIKRGYPGTFHSEGFEDDVILKVVYEEAELHNLIVDALRSIPFLDYIDMDEDDMAYFADKLIEKYPTFASTKEGIGLDYLEELFSERVIWEKLGMRQIVPVVPITMFLNFLVPKITAAVADTRVDDATKKRDVESSGSDDESSSGRGASRPAWRACARRAASRLMRGRMGGRAEGRRRSAARLIG